VISLLHSPHSGVSDRVAYFVSAGDSKIGYNAAQFGSFLSSSLLSQLGSFCFLKPSPDLHIPALFFGDFILIFQKFCL
jgi:hypothetical protein